MSYENVDPVQEDDTVNMFLITLLLPQHFEAVGKTLEDLCVQCFSFVS